MTIASKSMTWRKYKKEMDEYHKRKGEEESPTADSGSTA